MKLSCELTNQLVITLFGIIKNNHILVNHTVISETPEKANVPNACISHE